MDTTHGPNARAVGPQQAGYSWRVTLGKQSALKDRPNHWGGHHAQANRCGQAHKERHAQCGSKGVLELLGLVFGLTQPWESSGGDGDAKYTQRKLIQP